MPPVLFFPLRLPQLKLPRLLTLPLGTGLHPARSLALLALEPERLLCLGPMPAGVSARRISRCTRLGLRCRSAVVSAASAGLKRSRCQLASTKA